jgi:RNA polymerase sigma-70 factor (ECF subfamily)
VARSGAGKLDDVEQTDEALCQRVAQGDEAAFDVLVSRYQQRAWRLAWSILRDAEEARDISQEAFVRLYQTAGSFAGRSKFSTWFYRILVNLCLDQRRRRWWQIMGSNHHQSATAPAEEPLIERLPAVPYDPTDAVERERAVKQLWAEVDRLAPQQRAVVVLQVQEELSTREIASVLRCSEATVRVHLHRALGTLRKRMGKAER